MALNPISSRYFTIKKQDGSIFFGIVVCISKIVMKNKPDAKQSIRKGLSDIGGFSLRGGSRCSYPKLFKRIVLKFKKSLGMDLTFYRNNPIIISLLRKSVTVDIHQNCLSSDVPLSRDRKSLIFETKSGATLIDPNCPKDTFIRVLRNSYNFNRRV